MKFKNDLYSEVSDVAVGCYPMSKIATLPPNRPLSFFVQLKSSFFVDYYRDPLIEGSQLYLYEKLMRNPETLTYDILLF